MKHDAIRLIAHIGALRNVSDTYARACQVVSGSAYGVELRTLAVARDAMAERFTQRLRDLGTPARSNAGPAYVDVADLVAPDTRSGVEAVLQAERLLIADIDETSRDRALSDESRRLVLDALPVMRAHARRMETFLDTL